MRAKRGGWGLSSDGYLSRWDPSSPHARSKGRVPAHVLVAATALGKPLPRGAVVHHVNEVKTDNRPSNLVICQSQAYHMLLHKRLEALRATGHANWRKCSYCSTYDDPANLVRHTPRQMVHRACRAAYKKTRYHNSQGVAA